MILDFTQPLTINSLGAYSKSRNLAVGLTSGCWDLTHYYHLRYWERCKRYCDILIVGVDDDQLVKKVKGNARPIYHEYHRLRLVEHSRYVDAVFFMHTIEDFEIMAEIVKPHFIFKNQALKKEEILGHQYADEVVFINDVEEKMSTTEFIASIVSKNGG
jgi:cytidyltransferase-like protein